MRLHEGQQVPLQNEEHTVVDGHETACNLNIVVKSPITVSNKFKTVGGHSTEVSAFDVVEKRQRSMLHMSEERCLFAVSA